MKLEAEARIRGEIMKETNELRERLMIGLQRAGVKIKDLEAENVRLRG